MEPLQTGLGPYERGLKKVPGSYNYSLAGGEAQSMDQKAVLHENLNLDLKPHSLEHSGK